jgi:hypothetical protein
LGPIFFVAENVRPALVVAKPWEVAWLAETLPRPKRCPFFLADITMRLDFLQPDRPTSKPLPVAENRSNPNSARAALICCVADAPITSICE